MTKTHGMIASASAEIAACFGSSAASARFLQVDPIGYQDQVNLYAYVGNDPVNGTDPSGKECIPQPNGGTICDPPGNDIGRFYNRPFSYDLDDPLGQRLKSKMLSTYARTRKGNCVSMPILFLIVADRMGLKVRLAAAPLHLFVRYTDPAGGEHNLEATSGGHEARLEWYRANLPMTDRAIQGGIYMQH